MALDSLSSFVDFINRTLFADQGIVAVIGVVRITCGGTAAIAEGSEVEF